MSEDVYRLLREIEAEILVRSRLAEQEEDIIIRNGHLHIVSLLQRTLRALRKVK
jgi:hypothetical protein